MPLTIGHDPASSVSESAAPVTVPQLLDSGTLAKYRQAAPRVGYPRLQALLSDPSTLWYDQAVMPPSYQDSVAPTATVGCRQNDAGAGLINIIPGGRQIFSDDAKTFNYPFAQTAGTDKSTNVHIADFVSLPVVNGQRLPIVYEIIRDTRNGLGIVQWRWMYPKGTVFGEMLFLKGNAGALLPMELRTRERYGNGWATNSYRPFPTADALSQAIKARRPSWQANASLQRVVAQLADPSTLKPLSKRSSVFPGVYEQSGFTDELPDFGDAGLVEELLTQTTFASSYGATWKAGTAGRAFAATSAAPFGIVPNNNETGLLEVTDTSCARCHKDAQTPIVKFASQAILYGDIWGSDQIFSFHLFDPRTCHGAAEDNRQLRPEFASSGLVQKYDPSIHTAENYRRLP